MSLWKDYDTTLTVCVHDICLQLCICQFLLILSLSTFLCFTHVSKEYNYAMLLGEIEVISRVEWPYYNLFLEVIGLHGFHCLTLSLCKIWHLYNMHIYFMLVSIARYVSRAPGIGSPGTKINIFPEISVSPGDRRKSPASRPGRAGYSDPNKKINTLFSIQQQLFHMQCPIYLGYIHSEINEVFLKSQVRVFGWIKLKASSRISLRLGRSNVRQNKTGSYYEAAVTDQKHCI